MKWIIKLTGRQLWAVVFLCLFVIALTLADVLQALAMANFLDHAAAGDKTGFLRWFGIYFGLIFFQLLIGCFRGLVVTVPALGVCQIQEILKDLVMRGFCLVGGFPVFG